MPLLLVALVALFLGAGLVSSLGALVHWSRTRRAASRLAAPQYVALRYPPTLPKPR
ncbi:MAG: hypothetical protein IT371_11800 [Deltaproteobacteria bacterium]|nr:hypothetical protein [Deltaproteobacteria bacterium]